MSISLFRKGFSQLSGFIYLKKYQDEHIKVSIVSVSLLASVPHFGQQVFIHSLLVVKGLLPLPVNLISIGSTTGRSLSGTLTWPHFLQLIIGIGQPQYRCLDISQSLNLYVIFGFAQFEFEPNSSIFVFAISDSIPLNLSELIMIPLSTNSAFK